MKKKKINSGLFMCLHIMIVLLFSCTGCTENEKSEESYVTETSSVKSARIPMWKEYYYDGGMKFVILRDKYQGNINIINITKDSLECEFLKQKQSLN